MGHFRILHFSDIHQGIFPAWKDILWKKTMIGACNHALTRRKKQDFNILTRLAEQLPDIRPDYIIFTGDLTSIGTSEEFTRDAELLRPFREYNPERFIFLPGNHDRYSARPDWNRSLEETFQAMNSRRWQLSELPVSFRTPDAEFILIDGARPRPWYLSNGYLEEDRWERLEKLLADPLPQDLPRIILSHFPLYDQKGHPLDFRRQLNQWQRLQIPGEQSAFQLLLCGHIHHAFVNQHHGYTECCAGSITIHRQYAIIDFYSETQTFQCNIHPPQKGQKS